MYRGNDVTNIVAWLSPLEKINGGIKMSVINIRKAAIVGCGFVGSASAFALMESGLFSELVLVDADNAKAEGEALDKPKQFIGTSIVIHTDDDSRSIVEESVLEGFEPHFIIIKGRHAETLQALAEMFRFEVLRF